MNAVFRWELPCNCGSCIVCNEGLSLQGSVLFIAESSSLLDEQLEALLDGNRVSPFKAAIFRSQHNFRLAALWTLLAIFSPNVLSGLMNAGGTL